MTFGPGEAMPDFAHFEVARGEREEKRYGHAKVDTSSSDRWRGDRERCRSIGQERIGATRTAART